MAKHSPQLKNLMHDRALEIDCFQSLKEQCAAITEQLKNYNLQPSACCVIARKRKELGSIQEELTAAGQPCQTLDGRASQPMDGTLCLATMHKVKGLKFDAVFLASINEGTVPNHDVLDTAGDAITRRQKENEERALVYVSLTRARKLAFVFGYGRMSAWFVDRVEHG